MPTTQPSTGDVIQVSPFLNLVGGNEWVYENSATTPDQPVTIKCVQLSAAHPNELELTVDPKKILPDTVMEVIGVSQRQYKWLKAIMYGSTLTWVEGLLLPANWKVGETVVAKSQEHDPLWGGICQISLQLLNKSHPIPPELHLPLPLSTEVIDIEQMLKDIRSGNSLIENKLMFAKKVGLVYACGQNWGSFHVLKLKKWSGKQ